MAFATLFLAALKVTLASSACVMSGWQPMPDSGEGDSVNSRAKVEYLMQIEPEMLARLQAGQSIPITSDVPKGIGLIGRIRIVVGHDELPRPQLTTQLKPWPKSKLLDKTAGIVETQFRQPVSGSGSSATSGSTTGNRYAGSRTSTPISPPSSNASTQTSPILPPSGNTSKNSRVASNPFARSLQQGAAEAQNRASGAIDNVKQQILPPSGNELFGQSGGNRRNVQNAVNNVSDTAPQFTRDLQRSARDQVQQVADQAGQRMQQAVDNVGQRINQAVGQIGQSGSGTNRPPTWDQQQATISSNPTPSQTPILPGNNSAIGQGNGNASTPQGKRIDEPIRDRWQRNNGAPPADVAATPRFPTTSPVTAQPRTSQLSGGRYNLGGNPATTPARKWSSDPVDIANRNTSNSSPSIADRQPEFNSTSNTSLANRDGSRNGQDRFSLPPLPDMPATTPVNTTSRTANTVGPGITRDMMNSPPLGNQTQQPSGQFANRFPAAGPNALPTESPQPQQDNTVFPLILAWVLLCGSGVGNVYSVWSYLDLRHKYRGVVHGSSRGRDRYND